MERNHIRRSDPLAIARRRVRGPEAEKGLWGSLNGEQTMTMANNRFESDGLPFRCAPGQAAAQAKRYA